MGIVVVKCSHPEKEIRVDQLWHGNCDPAGPCRIILVECRSCGETATFRASRLLQAYLEKLSAAAAGGSTSGSEAST